MRKAVARLNRGQTSGVVSMPAPIKGWVTSDSLANMKPDQAVLLDNWWPETDSCRPRKGSVSYITGLGPRPVETVFSFNSGAIKKLFAACGPTIFDITDATKAPVQVLTGFKSARWKALNFVTSGGPQLLLFNGTDPALRFDGAAWSALAFTLDGVPVNGAIFTDACSYAQRLFLISGNTVFYPPVDSFQGELGQLQVGLELNKGGNLVALSRWTHDAGQGPQDTLCVVSEQGEIVVYQGVNPSNADSWNLIGKFDVAPVVGGNRSTVKLGGDLGILTQDGLQPMSKVMTLDRALDDKAALTANIRTALKDATTRYGSNFGWQVHAHRERAMLIVNVAKAEGSGLAEQYAMNIATGAWTPFKGMNAICWHSFNGALYYGAANGQVVKGDTGYGDLGQPTVYALISAFTAVKGRGSLKHAKMMKGVIFSSVAVDVKLGVCMDYVLALPGTQSAAQDSTAARWDSARWNISRWASSQFGAPVQTWTQAQGVGTAFAPAAYLTLDGTTPDSADIRLVAFDLLLEGGGVL